MNVRQQEWEKLPEETKYILAQINYLQEQVKEMQNDIYRLEQKTGMVECPCCKLK